MRVIGYRVVGVIVLSLFIFSPAVLAAGPRTGQVTKKIIGVERPKKDFSQQRKLRGQTRPIKARPMMVMGEIIAQTDGRLTLAVDDSTRRFRSVATSSRDKVARMSEIDVVLPTSTKGHLPTALVGDRVRVIGSTTNDTTIEAVVIMKLIDLARGPVRPNR